MTTGKVSGLRSIAIEGLERILLERFQMRATK
jgi:hypothetical protein